VAVIDQSLYRGPWIRSRMSGARTPRWFGPHRRESRGQALQLLHRQLGLRGELQVGGDSGGVPARQVGRPARRQVPSSLTRL